MPEGIKCAESGGSCGLGSRSKNTSSTVLSLDSILFRYGCIIYGSARPSYLKTLDPIHHQGLRLCLGAFRTTPVHSLYAEAGEPSLTHRRLKLALYYCLKLRSEPKNPAYGCVIKPEFKEKFEESPGSIAPLGIRLLPHLEDANINASIISDLSKFPDSPPWMLKFPRVCFDLAVHKKDSTSSLAYKALFADLCQKYPNFQRIFTDGSKSEEGVACAAFNPTSDKTPLSEHLPQESSVYTAELTALFLALGMVCHSRQKDFLNLLRLVVSIGGCSLPPLQPSTTTKIL